MTDTLKVHFYHKYLNQLQYFTYCQKIETMANLLYVSIHYAMWFGLGLCVILLFPYPRFLRRPLVAGLEKLLTCTPLRWIQTFFLVFVAFVWTNSLFQMNQHNQELIRHKAERQAAPSGASFHELDKTINQTRMYLFLDQRNAYMSFFVLMLFFVVFTYLYSLKKDDDLHVQLTLLEKDKKETLKKSAPTPTGQDSDKAKKD